MDWELFGIGYAAGCVVASTIFVFVRCRRRPSPAESDAGESLAAFAWQAAKRARRAAGQRYEEALEPVPKDHASKATCLIDLHDGKPLMVMGQVIEFRCVPVECTSLGNIGDDTVGGAPWRVLEAGSHVEVVVEPAQQDSKGSAGGRCDTPRDSSAK